MGFIHESFRIKKSSNFENSKFWNESAKRIFQVRTRKSRFNKIRDLQIHIFKDSFRAIVLKICKDSWKQVESFENGWIHCPRLETNLFKSGLLIYATKQLWICGLRVDKNPRVHNSLIWFPQPYLFYYYCY